MASVQSLLFAGLLAVILCSIACQAFPARTWGYNPFYPTGGVIRAYRAANIDPLDCFIGQCDADSNTVYNFGDVCSLATSLISSTGAGLSPVALFPVNGTTNLKIADLFNILLNDPNCQTDMTAAFNQQYMIQNAALAAPLFINIIESDNTQFSSAFQNLPVCKRDATCTRWPNGVARVNFVLNNFCNTQCFPTPTPTFTPTFSPTLTVAPTSPPIVTTGGVTTAGTSGSGPVPPPPVVPTGTFTPTALPPFIPGLGLGPIIGQPTPGVPSPSSLPNPSLYPAIPFLNPNGPSNHTPVKRPGSASMVSVTISFVIAMVLLALAF